MAARLGVSHVFIGHLENGRRPITVLWLGHLAKCYLISTDWLIYGDGPIPAPT